MEGAFLLGSDTLYREAGYVGLSRARQRSDLYLVADTLQPRQTALAPDPVEELVRNLSRSQALELALDQTGTVAGERPGREGASLTERQALLADPAPWLVDALGAPPLAGPDRDRWAERAARLAAYRDIYAVEGPDPLGPHPDDPHHRRAWELCRLTILEHSRTLEIDQGLHL